MSDHVAQHYGKGGLLRRVLDALQQAGKDLDHLTIDDLAPMDEFHARRRLGTAELSALLAPTASDHVVDIGSGLGGPSRYLAQNFGCRVSGVDLTPEFVDTAVALTARVGLSARVDFRQGSALALPFADASFDLGWSQNVSMNIADRPEISFLRTPEETRVLMEAAGFRVLHWIDKTDAAQAEGTAERARMADNPSGPPILGIHVVVGPSFREKMRNGNRAVTEGKTRLITTVLRKP